MLQRVLGLSVICLALVACADGLDNPHRANPTSPSSPTPVPSPFPNYAGQWSGTYTITGCTQAGGVALANLCASLGSTPPYSFSFTQGGQNVSGTFTLGSITFPNTGGTVAKDGSLALSATNIANGLTTVVNWALQFPGASIIGTVTQNIQSSTLSGSAVIAGSINSAIRGNLMPSVLPPPVSLMDAIQRLNDK